MDIPRAIQTAIVDIKGDVYKIANLHFTWAPHGIVNEVQLNDAYKVSKILEDFGQHILCGDFNTPVGSEVFEIIRNKAYLAEVANCDSTIDTQYHYAKDLKIIVDAIIFTEEYGLKNIEYVCGVSDHCALVAEIKRTGK